MTRVMYDSVNLSAIPRNAEMVAYYVDGLYKEDRNTVAFLFQHAVLVPIAVFASTDDGVVLDVEQGDATPAQAVEWVLMRRGAGIDPSVYCSASTWGAVDDQFRAHNVVPPHYWIAKYDGIAELFYGSVAKQYNDPPASGGDYDISIVADYWPGIDRSTTMTDPNGPNITQAEFRIEGIFKMADVTSGNATVHPETNQLAAFLNGLKTDVANLAQAVTALQTQVTALQNIKPNISGNFTVTGGGTVS